MIHEKNKKDAEKKVEYQGKKTVDEVAKEAKEAKKAVQHSIFARIKNAFRKAEKPSPSSEIDLSEFSQENNDNGGRGEVSSMDKTKRLNKEISQDNRVVTVAKGDRLENLVCKQFEQTEKLSQFFKELTSQQQAVVAGNFLKNLSPKQLETIKKGLNPDNLGNIQEGEKLDFSKVMDMDDDEIFDFIEKGKKFEGKLEKTKETREQDMQAKTGTETKDDKWKDQVTIETNVYGKGKEQITEEVFGPVKLKVRSNDTTSQLLKENYGSNWKKVLTSLEKLQEEAKSNPEVKQRLVDMGFYKGNINKIRPGKDLNLGNLFESNSTERKEADSIKNSKELPEIADVELPKEKSRTSSEKGEGVKYDTLYEDEPNFQFSELKTPNEISKGMMSIAKKVGGGLGADLERISDALKIGSQKAFEEVGDTLMEMMSDTYEFSSDVSEETQKLLRNVGRIFEDKKVVTYNPKNKDSYKNPR